MKVSSIVLGTALIALSGVTLHLWRQQEDARQQSAILTSQAQDRQFPAAVSLISTPAQTPTIATEPSQVSPESQLAGSSIKSDVVSHHFVKAPPDAATTQRWLDSPEGIASRRSRARSNQGNVYPDVDQALGLTTAEKEKLLDLLAEQRFISSGRLLVDPESAQDREARERKERQAEDAEVQALLGSKYPKWQEYKETQFAWQRRSELRAELNAAGIPLSQTQDQALIGALSAEQRSINQAITQGGSIDALARYTPENRQRLLNAAAPYLSPQQLDEFKGLLERRASTVEAVLGPGRMRTILPQGNSN